MPPTPDVRPVGDLPDAIGKTAARELSLHGITTLAQVATRSKRDLLAIHGVGPKAVTILGEALLARGLTFHAPAARGTPNLEEASMDDALRAARPDLWTVDRAAQNRAFDAFMAATDAPVPWAYDLWDELLAHLSHRDNHHRAIAAQVLCNLANSDPERRMVAALPALLALTEDPRFVTARHGLQALWKVGVAGDEQRALLRDGLARRFAACADEKNGTLTRYDIVQSFRKMYDATGDESLRAQALGLIETEDDPKYRKKYAGLWRRPRTT